MHERRRRTRRPSTPTWWGWLPASTSFYCLPASSCSSAVCRAGIRRPCAPTSARLLQLPVKPDVLAGSSHSIPAGLWPQVRVTEVMKANLESEAAALRQELAKQEQVGGWVGRRAGGQAGRERCAGHIMP